MVNRSRISLMVHVFVPDSVEMADQTTDSPRPIAGSVILATLVFSAIKNLQWPSSRILALNTLLELSKWTDDLVSFTFFGLWVKT